MRTRAISLVTKLLSVAMLFVSSLATATGLGAKQLPYFRLYDRHDRLAGYVIPTRHLTLRDPAVIGTEISDALSNGVLVVESDTMPSYNNKAAVLDSMKQLYDVTPKLKELPKSVVDLTLRNLYSPVAIHDAGETFKDMRVFIWWIALIGRRCAGLPEASKKVSIGDDTILIDLAKSKGSPIHGLEGDDFIRLLKEVTVGQWAEELESLVSKIGSCAEELAIQQKAESLVSCGQLDRAYAVSNRSKNSPVSHGLLLSRAREVGMANRLLAELAENKTIVVAIGSAHLRSNSPIWSVLRKAGYSRKLVTGC